MMGIKSSNIHKELIFPGIGINIRYKGMKIIFPDVKLLLDNFVISGNNAYS
jgi:hypothetical protein